MSRIFLSHTSKDTREAMALKEWLTEQRPGLAALLDYSRSGDAIVVVGTDRLGGQEPRPHRGC